MRNAGGYSVITAPGERDKEHDTITCAHCGQISFTKAGHGPLQCVVIKADQSIEMRDVAFCQSCYRHICPRCENKGCYPLMKRLDDEEKAARRGIILP